MKIFYSFIISCISILGYSQTILYQTESTSRTVQDPQTVVLAQGFHATSNVSNPFIAKIGPGTENLGGGPADSDAGATNPSGTTAPAGQSFHDTKGNIEVSGAGQLQFTLPIDLPQGVKTVSPNMSLIYLSNSGNGIAGFGWALSGVTTISRSGKNIEKDGELTSVKLNYSDYYSFNGQRLILKSGEYGKDGAEYVTEKYSNIKIKSVGAITGQTWQGPEYWEVTFEDGSQAWYGGITSGASLARTPIEYNIAKWRDAQGNYIIYNYVQTASKNVASVSSIQWGGNEVLNTPVINEITFNYMPRTLSEQYYVAGVSLIQDRILDNIVVKTNNNSYKKYTIEYGNNGTSYQFVNKITEYNSEGAAANPIAFDYPQPVPASVDPDYLPNSDPFSDVKLTGDLNGDSYIDFVMSNGTVKLGAFNNDTFTTIITNKYFETNAKVVSTLLDEEGQIYNGNGIVQYEEGKIVGYIFRNNIFVKVFEKLVYDESDCITGNEPPPAGCRIEVSSLNEGDINGDGISDIFLTLKKRICEWIPDPACNNITPNETTNRPDPCTILRCATYDVGNFIVDLKNQNNPVATYTIDAGINENILYNQQYMDIDGDGKVETINVSNNDYKVFEFVKTAPNQYLKKIRFTSNLVETKDPEFPVLFGDFNGDGKLDFTIPVTDTAIGKPDNWRFYIGTGTGFNNFLKIEFFSYRKRQTETTGNYNKFAKQYFFSIADINKDGKSDVLQIFSYNQINPYSAQGYRDFGYVISTKLANGAASDGTLNFQPIPSFVSQTYQVQDIQDLTLFTPLTNPIKANNNYYNVFLYWKEHLHRIKAPTPLSELARIKSINQGNGSIITGISYLEAVSNGTNIYKKVKKELYPYFSLERVDQTFVVSQLQQVGRKQDFRYRGMTGHLQGRGSIGYHQMARSSWYADGFENTKIWSGVEMDAQKFGQQVKEWSIRTNDENLIFPTDISVNNTQLLSFKQNNYTIQQLPNKVDIILPEIIIEKDFLKNITLTKSVIYNNYYLPSSTQININNNFSTIKTTFEYIHNPTGIGSNYYIGRPESKTVITQAYGDTKSTKEEYVYESNLLKTLKTWNRDNTEYLQETYNYDGFGNMIQKVITNSVDSQTQTRTSKYEPTGRFVEKNTDNLGLATSYTYNDRGQILTQTDPLDNKLTNIYDGWGKLMKSKTNLEGTTTYQYERDNQSNITITQYDPDGDVSKKFTNKLGQDYKTSTKAFGQGQFISQETQYDVLGRKTKESEPYFEGGNISQWNVIAYNDTFYPAKITATALATLNNVGEISSFLGKQIETVTSGNTISVTEVNGYARTNSKTTDALNNVISSTDKGGTVNFSYNAAGEQIKAQYAENIVTTKYDSWGRKSEFNDPSNGLYKYEYDPFGQTKKIISPKGTKEYIYNNLGQLISHAEISTTDGGQATNKIISYSYDSKGRIISKSGTSKGKTYSSNVAYDPQGRLLSSSESSNGRYYIQKGITYDDKARVISYEKQLYSSGILTKVTVENVYSAWNGELYQVKDKNSGKVLWELKETNAKGQVVRAKLGVSDINNTYNDATGFLTEIKHISPVQSILNIQYNFDVIKNELKLRKTLGDFNIIESFDYDDNNRLISWTNPRTGQNSQNSYDTKGRIIEIDQVGTIKYENSTKIYQPTGMTLNAAGSQNYNNDLIQSIAYNENNDPVFINGEKGDVAFQYGLTSMRQKVSYGGNFDPDQEGKFTKFYSEDGSFEIVKDNTTGKEKHVLYIGGNPYESNIIYLKNYDEANGSYKFLHKDYLGSILAISDEAGNKLEQRHFDAWGNFTHLQIGNGAIITDKNIIDNTSLLLERGYTSHEHFAEVGIIHMNGRLYDPLLRRFLNADENIQDPYNTQNYNKYGYVMNNPLMFNDPSGEYWEAGVFLTAVAIAIQGAIVGTIIAAGLYIVKSLVTGNWSWGGFAKSLLLGAVTGAATGGLTGGMSASGFNGAVIVGSMTGAISGGIDAVFNGQNFFTGLYRGAVMGAAIGGAGYAINYFVNGSYKSYYTTDNGVMQNGESYDPTISNETMNKNINTKRINNFTKDEIQEFGIGKEYVGKPTLDGHLLLGNDKGVLGWTKPVDFLTGKSDIVYSPLAAQNDVLLGKVMVHETAHAFSQRFLSLSIDINSGYDVRLNTTDHLAIYKLEHLYAKKQLYFKNGYVDITKIKGVFMEDIDLTYNALSPFEKSFFNKAYNSFYKIFNRSMK
ncbi:RHS repeat-associated core domain-containing protein [Chryseobacterium oranimense]|uniref:RHS repeat-associated core domain-containing protein n=1 Tax=Chryseobacterium oranimense TaxID=421058 RepID=A0A1M5P388_9FLAO|nr:RHS repeat-associated core domain-containing protein [Chryseobacterium oranimense]SHG96286.1 RHS repeat-associated core domain-containing protein [Chryseobacterium oranimense]